MRRGIKERLFLLACFAVPAALFVLLWTALSESVLTWIGYQLWLNSSIDDLLNNYRNEVAEICLRFLAPVLLGYTGLRWGNWFLSRRERAAAAGADGAGAGGEAG